MSRPATVTTVPDPTDSDAVEQAFAGTYDDGQRLLADYRRVKAHTLTKAEDGPSRIANKLGVEPSRVESWTAKGGRPSPVRGLDTLREHGWLSLEWNERPLTGLTGLLAWILIRGRIVPTSWLPLFRAPDGGSRERLFTAAEAANVDLERDDTDSRGPNTFKPSRAAAPLGRLLAVLGAPVGSSGEIEGLPRWLRDAPPATCRRVARLYVTEAAFPAPAGEGLAINEPRPPEYADALLELLQAGSEAPEAIWGPGWPIRLHAEAVEDLQREPTY